MTNEQITDFLANMVSTFSSCLTQFQSEIRRKNAEKAAKRIQSEIESVITTYEPRAELIKVEVRPDEDNNEYIINILFAIAESSEPIEFETYLQRVR